MKPKIFISSTCYGLEDIRASIKHHLESELDTVVYLSEDSTFPVRSNKHSFDICLDAIEECDVFILIIDKRRGGVYEKRNNKNISITRKEYEWAFSKDKKIITFVRREVFNFRNKFKLRLKKERELRKGLRSKTYFQEFQNILGDKSIDYEALEFIDLINSQQKNNWIFFYDTSKEIHEDLDNQMGYLLDDFGGLYYDFPLGDDYFSPLSEDVLNLISDSKFRKYNLKALSIHENIGKKHSIRQAKHLLNLAENFELALSQYINQEITLIDSALSSRGGDVFFATDTTIEEMRPKVWSEDLHFKKIISYSRKLSRSYALSVQRYLRVVIIRNPIKVINDSDWREAMNSFVQFHKDNNIKLGICLHHLVNAPLDPRLLNFYLVPGKVGGPFDIQTGIAGVISKSENPELLSLYENTFAEIIKICEDEGGFWVTPNMEIDDVVNELASLAGIEN